ncbi:MAG: polysaccharide biosynthesis protein [Syntrophaceae bacterium]|nr:polysaccharide biosynthesis protein [Syntrophaceae bacterium]
MHPQFKNPKFYFTIFCDALVFAVALVMAYLFRFEFYLSPVYREQLLTLLVWVVPLKSIVFMSQGLYRGMWRYTSIRDFWLLARASLLATVIIMALILFINRFEGYSRAVFIVDGLITFLFTGVLRMAIRLYYSTADLQYNKNLQKVFRAKKVLIIGAGSAGEKMLREIFDNHRLDYEVLGFIDDDLAKKGRAIHGIRVLGSVDDMMNTREIKNIQEILIAIPSATGTQMRRIVETCISSAIPYKILPSIGALIDGSVSVKVLRDISYEDLLGRPEVKLYTEDISLLLNNKAVLITGCGGSIGSELCRQVIKYNPRFLILLDSSEANLFFIQMEIENEKGFKNYKAILGRVQHEKLMEDIFSTYKPEVVFHAAAYKHVPMLETNPWEAVFNNILGSRMVMEMSIKYGVEKFVLVSTDKAVRPTNVMGASKRVTELIMQSLQGNYTRMMAVRFGNVIGSSGSVIPLFRRQIERGGPVTVTDPHATRYFMTIPEASQMILQAGAIGEGGEVFVLRMGSPINILDMARDLIRLSGKDPDNDIEIVYTGLRDGEKLYEEIISEQENVLPTKHEKIMILRSSQMFNGATDLLQVKRQLDKEINELIKLAECHDAQSIKTKLHEIVPEYTPAE